MRLKLLVLSVLSAGTLAAEPRCKVICHGWDTMRVSPQLILENAAAFDELPVDGVTYRKELLKTVHGDFHHGNFLFVDGKVNGFFDLEEFCEGYPTDDIVRYFVCAAEHLKGFGVFRLGRILERFAAAVRHMPYSREEWEVAINCLLLRKIYMKVKDEPVGFARAANLLFRARLYRRMKGIVHRILV